MTLPAAVPGLEMPVTGPLVDRFGRAHTYLRVSVTDRCNYRCTYCMPAEGLDWLPRAEVLSFEEIARLVRVLAGTSIRKVRLTGGEPTVRAGLVDLVAMIAEVPQIEDLAMTTNAHTLEGLAGPLRRAGLERVNVSIDALDPEVFARMTRGGDVRKVLAGIAAARDEGMTPVKLNCVVLKDVNDQEAVRLVEHFADAPDVEVRFIEYMPFSRVDAKEHHLPARVLRERLGERFTLEPLPRPAHGGPGVAWRLRETGQVVGFISPITEHFCDACNRLRIQADGHLRTCLSRDAMPSLRDLMRRGLDDAGLELVLRERIWGKVAGHEAHLGEDEGFRPFDGAMTPIGG